MQKLWRKTHSFFSGHSKGACNTQPSSASHDQAVPQSHLQEQYTRFNFLLVVGSSNYTDVSSY